MRKRKKKEEASFSLQVELNERFYLTCLYCEIPWISLGDTQRQEKYADWTLDLTKLTDLITHSFACFSLYFLPLLLLLSLTCLLSNSCHPSTNLNTTVSKAEISLNRFSLLLFHSWRLPDEVHTCFTLYSKSVCMCFVLQLSTNHPCLHPWFVKDHSWKFLLPPLLLLFGSSC